MSWPAHNNFHSQVIAFIVRFTLYQKMSGVELVLPAKHWKLRLCYQCKGEKKPYIEISSNRSIFFYYDKSCGLYIFRINCLRSFWILIFFLQIKVLLHKFNFFKTKKLSVTLYKVKCKVWISHVKWHLRQKRFITHAFVKKGLSIQECDGNKLICQVYHSGFSLI